MPKTRVLERREILCRSCGGLSPLYAASDGIFVCHTCDWYMTREDVARELDDTEIWTVYPTGELGYAESPVIVAAYTVQAVRDYLAAAPGSAEETWEFNWLKSVLSTGCDTAELGIEMPLEARLRCPECKTADIVLTCRQWSLCAAECGWAGMESEALYYGDTYQR